MTAELWGTLSVIDHKRPNAFVAELGLFDTLVVPVAPSGAETEEWSAEKWNGELQTEVLSWIPDKKIRRVPWDATQRGLWTQSREAALAKLDIDMIQEQRRQAIAAGGSVDDFNNSAFVLTRHLLQAYIDQERDRELVTGTPDDEVKVIPAYDGPAAFSAAQRDQTKDSELAKQPRQARLLQAFQWEFFAPADEDRPGKALTHRQLIEASLEVEARCRRSGSTDKHSVPGPARRRCAALSRTRPARK